MSTGTAAREGRASSCTVSLGLTDSCHTDRHDEPALSLLHYRLMFVPTEYVDTDGINLARLRPGQRDRASSITDACAQREFFDWRFIARAAVVTVRIVQIGRPGVAPVADNYVVRLPAINAVDT